jgi:CRISPR-associated endonuclease Csn1
MTPYEYIHSRNSKQWDEIVTWWKTLPELSSKRLEKLLTEHLDVTDRRRFIERDINDTRYIARAIKNYIEDNLLFKPADVIRRVYTFNGKFTSVLRARYGLNKDRDLNNRHHALDAILIGIADDSMLQKISDYSKGDENFQSITEKDKKRFPLPWDNFRDDVYIRVFDENPEQQLENLQIIKHYGEYRKFIRPLFVSWMVDKKVTGAAHEETVYSIKEVNGRDMLVVKKPVSSLKVSDLANIYGEDPALKMALIDHSNKYPDTKGKLAFAKDAPRIYKPSESGQANEIKSVKVICGPATNYVNIHKGKGVAPQSSMIRVDIFKKYGKHYFIPIYVHHTTGKELPNKVVSRQNIQVDDSFDFLFSVYPNEYLVLSDKGNVIAEGYYAKANSNNGQFTLRSHDYSKPEQTPTIQNRDSLRKFTVNLLGYKYEIKQEKRHGFSSRRHNETI